MVAAVLLALSLQQAPKLPNGDSIRIVGITDSSKEKSWSADGKRIALTLPETVKDAVGKHKGQPNPTNILTVIFAIDRPRAGDVPSVAFKAGGSKVIIEPLFTLLDDEPKFPAKETVSVGLEHGFGTLTTTDVSIGVSTGSWKVVGSSFFRAGRRAGSKGLEFKPVLRSGGSKKVGVEVALPSSLYGTAYEVVAFDSRGTHMFALSLEAETETAMPDLYWFEGSVAQVSKVELQARPLVWRTFKGIPLKPR